MKTSEVNFMIHRLQLKCPVGEKEEVLITAILAP
jgi:hypothetical protein